MFWREPLQVGDPEEEIEKVAQAGIPGMVGARGRDDIGACDVRWGSKCAHGTGRVEPDAFPHDQLPAGLPKGRHFLRGHR